MYAVISPDKIEIPPDSVFQMPGSWSEYETLSNRSRYFPDFNILQLVSECFTDAENRNTSAAIRQLRQKLNEG